MPYIRPSELYGYKPIQKPGFRDILLGLDKADSAEGQMIIAIEKLLTLVREAAANNRGYDQNDLDHYLSRARYTYLMVDPDAYGACEDIRNENNFCWGVIDRVKCLYSSPDNRLWDYTMVWNIEPYATPVLEHFKKLGRGWHDLQEYQDFVTLYDLNNDNDRGENG